MHWIQKKKFSIFFDVLIAVEIFWFSSMSGGVGGGISFVAVFYHFIVFFLFAFFFFSSVKGGGKIQLKHLVFVLFFSLLYAALDEVHQSFVPMRDASFTDFLTDSAGIFLAVLLHLSLRKL